MSKQQPYTLGKTERLKSRKLIAQLFSEGQSFSCFPFRVLLKHTDAANEVLKTGFSVSSRYFKKAVDRNRIKRLMREAWRLQKNLLQDVLKNKQQHIIVFIIYTGQELPPYQLVYEKTQTFIKRIIKLINETAVADT
ncbi:MAG: ribonuclease P protein component [Ferruginibacter sp.]